MDSATLGQETRTDKEQQMQRDANDVVVVRCELPEGVIECLTTTRDGRMITLISERITQTAAEAGESGMAHAVFDNVDKAEKVDYGTVPSTGKLGRQIMWLLIAVFAAVRYYLARQSLEPGFMFDPSAPQIAQVWTEYIAQVVLAVTCGLAVTFEAVHQLTRA